jgi:hypothetical protein
MTGHGACHFISHVLRDAARPDSDIDGVDEKKNEQGRHLGKYL